MTWPSSSELVVFDVGLAVYICKEQKTKEAEKRQTSATETTVNGSEAKTYLRVVAEPGSHTGLGLWFPTASSYNGDRTGTAQ